MRLPNSLPALSCLVLLSGAVACHSPSQVNSIATPADKITQDFQETAPSLSKETAVAGDAKSQSTAAVDMYSKGCKSAGEADAVMALDPELKVNSTYTIAQSQLTNGNSFALTYVVLAQAPLPTATAAGNSGGELVYSGEIDTISAPGFNGIILNQDNRSITRKYILLDPSTEKFMGNEIQFSDSYVKYSTQAFANADCTLTRVIDPAQNPIDKSQWSSGQFTLGSPGSQTASVQAYVKRSQYSAVRTCAGSSPQNVVVTRTRITSNGVVASHFSHCGGETVFEKQVVRDIVGNIVTMKSYQLIDGPLSSSAP